LLLRDLNFTQVARLVRKSPYWRDGPPLTPSPHRGRFAPRFGPRPYPQAVYEEDEPCPWNPKPRHNVLQAITFVTGHLGSGKSYYAVRKIRDYVVAGKYVMINFDLTGAWWSTFVSGTYTKKQRLAGLMPDRYQRMRYILRHVYRFYDQSELYDWTLPGDPNKEDRGLLVIDEAALNNNTRTWKERGDKARDTTGDQLAELEFYVHMRKAGWTCLMLTQDSDMVDKQLRGTTSNEVHLRNLAKVKLPLLNQPVRRKPYFIAINYYHEGRSKQRQGAEYYGLDVKLANHYKSNFRFSRRSSPAAGRLGLMYDYEHARANPPFPFDPEVPLLPYAATLRSEEGGGGPQVSTGDLGSARRSSGAVLVAPPECATECTEPAFLRRGFSTAKPSRGGSS
jgi:hypothetical protein